MGAAAAAVSLAVVSVAGMVRPRYGTPAEAPNRVGSHAGDRGSAVVPMTPMT
jgi:hypothetical protein